MRRTRSRRRTSLLLPLTRQLLFVRRLPFLVGEQTLDPRPVLPLDHDETDVSAVRVAAHVAALVQFELERLVEHEVALRIDADKGPEEHAGGRCDGDAVQSTEGLLERRNGRRVPRRRLDAAKGRKLRNVVRRSHREVRGRSEQRELREGVDNNRDKPSRGTFNEKKMRNERMRECK